MPTRYKPRNSVARRRDRHSCGYSITRTWPVRRARELTGNLYDHFSSMTKHATYRRVFIFNFLQNVNYSLWNLPGSRRVIIAGLLSVISVWEECPDETGSQKTPSLVDQNVKYYKFVPTRKNRHISGDIYHIYVRSGYICRFWAVNRNENWTHNIPNMIHVFHINMVAQCG